MEKAAQIVATLDTKTVKLDLTGTPFENMNKIADAKAAGDDITTQSYTSKLGQVDSNGNTTIPGLGGDDVKINTAGIATNTKAEENPLLGTVQQFPNKAIMANENNESPVNKLLNAIPPSVAAPIKNVVNQIKAATTKVENTEVEQAPALSEGGTSPKLTISGPNEYNEQMRDSNFAVDRNAYLGVPLHSQRRIVADGDNMMAYS
jgi:hypothetical protein